MCLHLHLCVEIVCDCVHGTELIFGLGFWGVSLPLVGGTRVGDSGLTGESCDKILNFVQWVWSLRLGGGGAGACGLPPKPEARSRLGEGVGTSCFRGRVQYSLSGWDACHFGPRDTSEER